jgi:hypothetical protein
VIYSDDPERWLVEAVVEFLNCPITSEERVVNSFGEHPWLAERRPLELLWWYDTERALRAWRGEQDFMRRGLIAFLTNRPAFHAKHATVLAEVTNEFAILFPPPAEQVDHEDLSPRSGGGASVDFTFHRGRGFSLQMHPVFDHIREAIWFGFALLLDARRDLARGLTRCHAPSRSPVASQLHPLLLADVASRSIDSVRSDTRRSAFPDEKDDGLCGRIFWRSVRRLRYCSPLCSKVAANRANVRRQQRHRKNLAR